MPRLFSALMGEAVLLLSSGILKIILSPGRPAPFSMPAVHPARSMLRPVHGLALEENDD